MEQWQTQSKEDQANPPRPRLATGLIIGIVLLGALFIIFDWAEIRQILLQADWRPLPAALLLTGVSYLCVGYAFALISRMLGIEMKKRDLAAIGYVSTILNHVLTTGGVAGYSVRYFLMRRHGVGLREVLTASILHFYLTSLDMLSMLPVGFLYLLLNTSLPAGVTALIGLMTLLMGVVFIFATGLIFFRARRASFMAALARLVRRLTRRDLTKTFRRFDQTLSRGVVAMRERPLATFLVLGLTWIDWFSSVAVLGLCFYAFGEPVGLGPLISGYVIGVMAGVLSMVPGGLGVQEGSMAGVFVLLGVPFEQALLASVLFRVVYFLIPYIASLGFYGRLLRQK